MSICGADGFDTYGGNASKMLEYRSVCFLSSYWSHHGIYSAFITNGGEMVWPIDGTTKTVAGFGFHTNIFMYEANMVFFRAYDSTGVEQCRAYINSSGRIQAYCGSNLLGSSESIVEVGPHHIETWARIDNLTGWIEIRVDGVVFLRVTNVKTQHTAIAGCYYLGVKSDGMPSDGNGLYIDDLIWADDSGTLNNSFIGPGKRVIEDVCDSDVAATGYTPTSGTSVSAMLDDIPEDGDTSVVTSTASGDNFEVGFPALDDTVNNFLGVIFSHVSKKSDAGDATMTISSVSGSSVSSGSANALATGYNVYNAVFEVDPATNAPWTNAAAQAATARFTHGA
jgi:hypothetical protein